MSTRTYHLNQAAVFYKTKEALGGLSNMAAGFPLQVNNLDIRTSEALYQALRFPQQPAIQQEIIDQASPMAAKMVSKKHRPLTRADWPEVRVKIMRWCLRVKLLQHWEAFGGLLLSTGERPIVERSRRDRFWGAVLDKEQQTLEGENVLGRLLMELRQIYQTTPTAPLTLEPLSLAEFYLMSKQIESVQPLYTTHLTTKQQPQQGGLF